MDYELYFNYSDERCCQTAFCVYLKKTAEFKKNSVTKQVGGLVTVLLTETFCRDRQGQAMKTL